MYLIVLGIFMYHVLTCAIWLISGQIKVAQKLTADKEEYLACSFPAWRKIR